MPLSFPLEPGGPALQAAGNVNGSSQLRGKAYCSLYDEVKAEDKGADGSAFS